MKIKLGVIFGGVSVEHEVSVITAIQAMNNIDTNRYDVIAIYITKDGDWYTGEMLKDIKIYSDMDLLKRYANEVVLYKTGGRFILQSKGFLKREITEVDICFPIMHGTNGEDGSIQGLLEMLKLPYAGCDVIAAGCGQDKSVMKHMLENSGLPLCPWIWIYGCDYDENKDEIKAKVAELGYPVVLKPACLGSSVGIVIAHSEEMCLSKPPMK